MRDKTSHYVLKDFEGVTVIRFTDENLASTTEVDRIRGELETLVDNGIRRMVLDFKLVKFIGSAALSLMLALHHKLKAVEGRLALSHPETIQELLDVSRTGRLFLIAPDPKAAARMIK